MPLRPFTPVVSMSAFMLRPGQTGALDVFDGENISDYLDNFNAECELYGVKPEHRAIRFPYYCGKDIKEIVTILPGFDTHDWNQLPVEMKKFYWQDDHPKNTFTALNALTRRHDLPLGAYLLKFTAVTDALVAKESCLVPSVSSDFWLGWMMV